MAVHFILLFCQFQRFSLFIREVCFCPWLEALSASSTGALCVGLRSNPLICTISALTWELETHKMFYIYPTWHSIISSCMSAYASVPGKKSSKAKKGSRWCWLFVSLCMNLWYMCFCIWCCCLKSSPTLSHDAQQKHVHRLALLWYRWITHQWDLYSKALLYNHNALFHSHYTSI